MTDDHDRDGEGQQPLPHVRDAIDAASHEGLKADPTDSDAKLDVALDESFPTSDAPSHTRPGADDPAPSSGYDEAAERALARGRSRDAAWQRFRLPVLAGIAGAIVIAALAIVSASRSRN